MFSLLAHHTKPSNANAAYTHDGRRPALCSLSRGASLYHLAEMGMIYYLYEAWIMGART